MIVLKLIVSIILALTFVVLIGGLFVAAGVILGSSKEDRENNTNTGMDSFIESDDFEGWLKCVGVLAAVTWIVTFVGIIVLMIH